MTRLLAQAFDEVKKLPVLEQDAMAAIIMAELLDEKRWAEAFANSQDKLAKLAEKVRADIAAGRRQQMGFDEL